MRRSTLLIALVVGSGAMSTDTASVHAALVASTTDLWDVSQGTIVTSHTGVLSGSDPRNMFGFISGAVTDATVNTLFRDGQQTGTLHAIEWQTSSPITLRSFTLFAAHDGAPRDANARGFSRFTLYAFNSVTNAFDNLIFQLFPSNPYGTTPAPASAILETNADLSLLALGVNVSPLTAQRFRAEFVQFGFFASNASGPRVLELDGYNEFLADADLPIIPEPQTLALCSLLAVTGGLLAPRRRPRAS